LASCISHLAFFFFHMVFHIFHQLVEFDIKRLIICVEFPQLLNELFDALMFLKAFRHKLFSCLGCLIFEDGLFELIMGFQLDKDLLRNLALSFLILRSFVVLEQLSDLLVIRCQHLNDILRLSGIISRRCYGTLIPNHRGGY
jgi:hypothetical protein